MPSLSHPAATTQRSLYMIGGKRLLDLLLAIATLLVLAPLFVVVAVLVRLDDGGPAIFRQTRTGRGGHPFTLFKFRSMPVGTANRPSSEAAGIQVTRVGRMLRRTNIDELPQLVNIARGDMSVVGPRPALPVQVELLALRDANGAAELRPGLTGLTQVMGFDGMSVPAKADLDGRYSKRITFISDLVIIARTVGYLTRRPPVY